MLFTIATWNVNSLKVRLPQVLEWLATAHPDVLAIQETKIIDADFPRAEIEAAGYHVSFSGQKTYNGVAILSREPMAEFCMDLPDFLDPQRRVLCATIADLRVINLYVPNGSSVGSEKYVYKLEWLAVVKKFLRAELQLYPKTIVLGDFNIAPEDHDVHDPKLWEGQVLVSESERAAFREFLSAGFTDTFRLFDQPENSFTWWDYRQGAFRRNNGLRIDHILASKTLAAHCVSCEIDKAPRANERPSDHVPVIAKFQSLS